MRGPNKQILLNSSNAASTDNNGFNAAPDETFVHLGSGAAMATNQNGQNIAYIWAEFPGYSRSVPIMVIIILMELLFIVVLDQDFSCGKY